MATVVVTSGKRKSAVARAYARKGKGRVRINNMILQTYPDYIKKIMMEPIELADKHNSKIDVSVKVTGGGPMSQAEAVRTAIAKALFTFTNDKNLKATYMEYDRTLLVNDTRRSEPKKQMGRGARKRRQKSYR
jgi:small subunit ribosomal protein S9